MYELDSSTETMAAEAVRKTGRKEKIKTAIIVFLVIMLLLTFFSNTIMNRSLAEVAVQYVEPGEISPQIRGVGTAEVESPYNLTISGQRTIASVQKQVGDKVEKGDVIYKLEAGGSEELKAAQQELAQAKTAFEKTLFSGDLTDAEITRIRNGEWRSEDTMQAQLADVNSRYNAAKKSASSAEAAVNRYSGGSSSSDGSDGLGFAGSVMMNASGAMARISRLAAILFANTGGGGSGSGSSGSGSSPRNYEEAVKQKEKADQTLESVTAERDAVLKSISTELDLREQKAAIEAAQDKVDALSGDGDGSEVTAPVTGTIISLTYAAGETTAEDAEAAVIQIEGKDLVVNISCTKEEAQALKTGQKADPQYAWYYSSDFSAKLRSISRSKEDKDARILTFTVECQDVEPGDQVALTVPQNSKSYDLCVPNSAIHTSNDGKFILIVQSRQSPLGNRYIAQKVPVTVEASDESMTAISADLTGYEYVITTSSREVKPGEQVRLAEDADV